MSDATISAGRGDRTRAALVAAGMECLVEEGWAGLTHRRVAVRADVNAGLVHYHFGSIGGLRSAVARHASDALIRPAMSRLRSGASVEALVTEIAELVRAALGDAHGVRLLTQIVVGTGYYPEVAEEIRPAIRDARAALAERLVELDPGWAEDDARDAAALLLGAIDGVMLHGLVDGVDAPVRPPGTARLEALVRGALTRPATP